MRTNTKEKDATDKPMQNIMDHPGYAAAFARVAESSAQREAARERLRIAQLAAQNNPSFLNKLDAERALQELQRMEKEAGEAFQERASEHEAACLAIEGTMAKADAGPLRAYYLGIVAMGNAIDELKHRNAARAAAGSWRQITTGSRVLQFLGDPCTFASTIHRELHAGLLCGAITEKDLPAHWPAKQIAAKPAAYN